MNFLMYITQMICREHFIIDIKSILQHLIAGFRFTFFLFFSFFFACVKVLNKIHTYLNIYLLLRLKKSLVCFLRWKGFSQSIRDIDIIWPLKGLSCFNYVGCITKIITNLQLLIFVLGKHVTCKRYQKAQNECDI